MEKPYLGVWLDHREAYLVWMDEQGHAQCRHIEAEHTEGGNRPGRVVAGGGGGGRGVYGTMAPHVHMEEKRHREAKRFYDHLFKAIRTAQGIYIFGPGQAKHEMHKRLLEHKDFNGRVRAVAGAERMTEPQLAAQVRAFFGLPYPSD